MKVTIEAHDFRIGPMGGEDKVIRYDFTIDPFYVRLGPQFTELEAAHIKNILIKAFTNTIQRVAERSVSRALDYIHLKERIPQLNSSQQYDLLVTMIDPPGGMADAADLKSAEHKAHTGSSPVGGNP